MFKLATQPAYWWPVTFRQPSATEPGKYDQAQIEVQYRYLTVEAHLKLMEQVRADGLTDRQVAPRIVADFRGIEDDAGSVVAFSPAALEQLTNIPGVDAAIVAGYFTSRSEAAAKN